ncbi:glycosyltransferase [Alicyclobacillus mengziensis]|uniref:Glycosyltransferase n=1 Tax=Alicyclobacillus mengziensis TaxID=2931921 RepID=A0A9X7Z8F3_9BACL|nr:glycosyltransferase [Alicyclobacillus mengziensis]QSO48151.1 glycosyltransferase [Alicyclobacillus mengziensis]
MKIDILSDRHGGQGGMETVFTMLGRELRSRGVDVRFVLTQPSESPQWEETLGDVCHIIEDVSLLSQLDYRRYRAVLNFEIENFYHQEEKPDVVLVAISGWETAVRRGVGSDSIILSWPHFTLNLSIGPDGDDEIKALADADALVAIAPSIQAESMRKHPNLPTFVIGNPIELHVNEIPRPSDVPTFLYIGRLVGQKRVDWIIKAFARIRTKPWRLKIIGGGILESSLKQLAGQLGIQRRIEWVPFQEEPWNCVNEASALLLMSQYEGFPMVILEALARGVPVIAADCPTGPSDIIKDGENGYLVGVDDYDSFVDTILDVIDGNLDLPEPDVCRASVEMYEATVVVDRLLSVIRTVEQQGEVLVK